MIAAQVGRAIGTAVDWSLIHLLGAVSDRVEGRRADCYRRADQLADIEAGRDYLEPGDLAGGYPISSLTSDIDWGGTETARLNRDAMQALQDALVRPDPAVHGFSGECPDTSRSCEHEGPTWSCAECGKVMHTITAAGSPTKRGLFCSAKCAADAPEIELDRIAPESLAAMINMQSASPVRSAAVTVPAADNTRCAAAASIAGDPFLCGLDTGHAGPHHNPHQKASWIDAGADEGTAAELFAIGPADRTDQTDQTIHLEAAFNYHKGAVGYAAMRAGGVEWFCEGCSWSGPTKQAHARHRFQVLADMSAATGRVNEQLGGAS